MTKVFLFIFISTLVFTSCKDDAKNTVDVSKITIDFSVKRFHIDFYTATQKKLPILKKKYPLLFPAQTSDSIWISKIDDIDEQLSLIHI